MGIYKFLVQVILLLVYNFCFSQSKIDSLEKAYNIENNTYKKGYILYKLQGLYYHSDAKKLMEYILKLKEFALINKSDSLFAYYSNAMGNKLSDEGKNEESFIYYKKMIELGKKTGNKKASGNAYLSMGVVQMDMGEFKKANNNFNLAFKDYSDINDKDGQIYYYSNMAALSSILGNNENAVRMVEQSIKLLESKNEISHALLNNYINYAMTLKAINQHDDRIVPLIDKAIDYAQRLNDSESEARCHMLLAEIFSDRKQQERSRVSLKKAITNYKSTNNFMQQGYIFVMLAETFLNENADSAIIYCCVAIKIFDKIKSKNGLGVAYASMGNIYTNTKDYEKAERLLLKAENIFSTNEINNENYELCLRRLGGVYHERKNFERAKYYYELLLNSTELEIDNKEKGDLLAWLADIEKERKNYKVAISFYESSLNIRDTAGLTLSVYETEKLEKKYKVKELESKNINITKLLNTEIKIKTILISSIMGLFLITLIIFYLLFISKKKQRVIESQKKEIQIEKQNVETLNGFLQHETKRQLGMIHGASKKIATANDPVRESGKLNDMIRSIFKVYDNILLSDNKSEISLKKIIEEIFHDTCISFNVFLELTIEGDIQLSTRKVDVLMMAINEIIVNSFEHAFEGVVEPAINFKLDDSHDHYTILYKDNGKGFEFNENKLVVGKGMYHLYSLLTQNLGASFTKEKSEKGTNYKITVKHDSKKGSLS
ncbi:MAG: tetratricopeptide repeat protein [Bacteroidetes bacterium]|nr:tetratricopeptide repeat protein [Bacteroidota bacterium]